MPITKSAEKALRQNVRRRKRNVAGSDKLKTAIKRYKKLVIAGNATEAKTNLPAIYRLLDKSAKTGLIKSNRASRLKSRLTRQLKAKSTKTSS